MDNRGISWCACKGHNAKDWKSVSYFYAQHFIPHGWALEYHTLNFEEGRTLYQIGTCDHCGGFMRSGTGLAINISGDRFLADVYREMEHYRPHDGHDQESGTYCGRITRRSQWYQRQDDLTLEERNKQFLHLFRTEDRETVMDWLTRNHAEELYISPRRDRKSTLLQRILEAARADGAISKAEAILDYILPSAGEPVHPDEDFYLTDYRFDIIPRLMFGCEGIYLHLYLDGSFDSSKNRQTSIGMFKTLRTDVEACQLMGALGGALMYYGREYVNREIHRYTPKKQLEGEARQT